jgi:glycosyltransferase involved in cell wall biosynthesis
VDCTHTFQTGARTGIQRVVRHYADALLEIGPASGFAIVPVRVANGHCIPIPVGNGRVAFPSSGSAREAVQDDPAGARERNLRAWGHRLNRILRSRRFANWLDAGPNADGLARRVAASRGAIPQPDALALASTDILLSLDSSWVYDIRSVLDEAGRAGATRIAVLCDVLPLSHPQWFTEGTKRWFRGWIEAILPRLDGVVAISQTTCAELRQLAVSGAIAAPAMPSCTAVHLGAEIATGGESEVRSRLHALLAPGRPPAFLTVGTLEPRKNVDFALDLFDALAARGLAFQWHIVGAPGWLAEHTAQRIRGHPQFGQRLHWWTDLDDGELAWCYRNAAALVAVSKAEGFGLPLVEARLQGLPVFASDIPVFREVLGSEARFLPLSDARLAAAALEDFLLKGTGDRGQLRGSDPDPISGSGIARSWKESAKELLEAVKRIDGQRRQG